MAYPSITPKTLLPLLSLLCERGAKRQVLAGGHFLLPMCWTKTHPAAWHCLDVFGVEARGRGVQASESFLSVLVDPSAPSLCSGGEGALGLLKQ